MAKHGKVVWLTAAAVAAAIWASGCGGAKCAKPGGAVMGAADAHCVSAQVTNEASCHPAPDAGTAGDGGIPGFGATLFNAEGDDDDCKYHVKWTASDVCESTDVTFHLTLTKKADGTAATGAMPMAEVFLSDTHPAPNSDAMAMEGSNGAYDVGPIRFDASGRWTVRFHFYGDCDDGPTSPHGHAAFFVDVP